ncbi:BirA family transcriptional regulator, biotin operon repressor / biotin-[acetyl-CoA-carboxylase] ligase [Clostridium cavendishii DSM 21758]|uniref:Bifunctional ligase/repressor BirA n=1 Tax=Clostridium cavendishii DSM 21758 TaxID=1121302 RepID=A0A1M6F4U8_9CLOT|nr:biotin--[acetyl-CoA-carboxylase] ligase [Clostridium cavendishii]SHI92682.1 BirA family transcriptional regulator, biotin operon repressor / biotin-[acetyl-CoA-carboxylase] ligase [Clostridium cavendishii DSM 21758]
MKEKILNILLKNKSTYTSGEFLSGQLNISRAAIWKHIKSLREDGYTIESYPRKGYKLITSANLLTKEEISPYLKTKFIGRNLLHFDTIDSTNTKAKELWRDLENGTLIVSEFQKSGRGRLGRPWCSSPRKNILCSIVLKPNMDIKEIPKVTSLVAAVLYKTFNDFSIDVKIKWPNDLFLNSKKIAGILTEMSGDMDSINYLIIGIGININSTLTDFNEEINKIATSLNIEYGHEFSRQEFLAKFLNNFEEFWTNFTNGNFKEALTICRENSNIINKDVLLISRGVSESVTVLNLNDDSSLLVLDSNNKEKTIFSGEISIRNL